MNELRDYLDKHMTWRNAVVIGRECSGLEDDNKYCLAKSGRIWIVYYFEKGQRVGEREFESEEEACLHLLTKLKRGKLLVT
jgi:hypothetical protein